MIDRHGKSLEERQAEVWIKNRQTTMAVCHPDKEEYKTGTGLCRRCYDSIRHTGERGRAKAVAHVEANTNLTAAMRADVVEQIGKIQAYVRKPEPERKHVDTRKSSVRRHTAKLAILNNLDFDQTAAQLKPDLQPYEQANLARKLESDPQVNHEIQQQLSTRGLSDSDRDHFVRKLWQLFESNDPRQEAKAIAAMRILGKAFITEKVENTQVEKLTISGISDGLARMLGQDAEAAQSSSSPFESVRANSNPDIDFDE